MSLLLNATEEEEYPRVARELGNAVALRLHDRLVGHALLCQQRLHILLEHRHPGVASERRARQGVHEPEEGL